MSHYYKKKAHIRVDCYALKNKNKVVGVTDKGKQLGNMAEADVEEDGQSEGKLLLVNFDMVSKPYEE